MHRPQRDYLALSTQVVSSELRRQAVFEATLDGNGQLREMQTRSKAAEPLEPIASAVRSDSNWHCKDAKLLNYGLKITPDCWGCDRVSCRTGGFLVITLPFRVSL